VIGNGQLLLLGQDPKIEYHGFIRGKWRKCRFQVVSPVTSPLPSHPTNLEKINLTVAMRSPRPPEKPRFDSVPSWWSGSQEDLVVTGLRTFETEQNPPNVDVVYRYCTSDSRAMLGVDPLAAKSRVEGERSRHPSSPSSVTIGTQQRVGTHHHALLCQIRYNAEEARFLRENGVVGSPPLTGELHSRSHQVIH
jgi:hypothetical protein